MNYNGVIGTLRDTTLVYAIQGTAYTKISQALKPQSVILIRNSARSGTKAFKSDSRSYVKKYFNN